MVLFRLGKLVLFFFLYYIATGSALGHETDFSFKLFNDLSAGSKENIVISPFSAYVALSMALNGAAGSTREKMSDTLGIASDTMDSLNERNHNVLNTLNLNKNVSLKIASAVFADKNAPFKSSFIDLCKLTYFAQTENIDFKDSRNALKSINDWCYANTQGKIPTIIDSLKSNEKMVILNAVYFKGQWVNSFKEMETQDDKFITTSGEISDIKMMHKVDHLLYFKGEDFKAIAIPYVGKQQSLYIFLPNKRVDLALFQAQLNQKNWDIWMSRFRDNEVNLSLPKFTVNYLQDFSKSLKAIGMTEAFEPEKANFSNLACFPYKAWISRVLQTTYLDIDEHGTEAAAATAVVIGMRATLAVKPQPIEFRVDHPFILALVDNDSQNILFLASIVKL